MISLLDFFRRNRRALPLFFLLAICLGTLQACKAGRKTSISDAPRSEPPGPVYLLAHTEAEPGEDKAAPGPFSCDGQPMLTSMGRSQAGRLGEAFRRRGVLAGPVFASRYCRALDTARLAFGPTTPEPLVTPRSYADREERDEHARLLGALLKAQLLSAHSIVVVTHPELLRDLFEVDLRPGEALAVPPAAFEAKTLPAFRAAVKQAPVVEPLGW